MENLDKNILLHRFLSKTKITEDGHYLWLGATISGYGVISVSGMNNIKIHRLAAYIYHGLDINNKELLALHKNSCPYKNCWAENCIYIGTHKDNMRDIKNLDRFRCGHLKEETKMWIPSEKRWKCRTCNYMKGRASKARQWKRKHPK